MKSCGRGLAPDEAKSCSSNVPEVPKRLESRNKVSRMSISPENLEIQHKVSDMRKLSEFHEEKSSMLSVGLD